MGFTICLLRLKMRCQWKLFLVRGNYFDMEKVHNVFHNQHLPKHLAICLKHFLSFSMKKWNLLLFDVLLTVNLVNIYSILNENVNHTFKTNIWEHHFMACLRFGSAWLLPSLSILRPTSDLHVSLTKWALWFCLGFRHFPN